MPGKIVTLKRWHLGLAFALITVTFVVSLLIVSKTANQAHRLAVLDAAARQRDAAAAKRDAATAAERRKDRDDQIVALRKLAVESCHDRHVINKEVRRLISESISASARLDLSSFPPAQRAAIEKSRRESVERFRGSLERLRKADCTGIPKIPSA